MNYYIGSKLIKAEKAYKCVSTGKIIKETQISKKEAKDNNYDEGYQIEYSDGYKSWSPKEIFEKSYLKVNENKNLPSGVSIGQQMVDDFIVDYEVFTNKGKITIVIATLKNGFTIVESSACVDPKNYDEKIGSDICKERIKNQVWNYLGFLLQTAFKGIK